MCSADQKAGNRQVLVLFTTIYFLCVFVYLIECGLPCPTNDCQKNVCPSSCSCLGSLVDCSKSGLLTIPQEIPTWVEFLDLQDNDISSVDDHAFDGLKNLKELDLSSNQLRFVNSSSIRHLSSLHRLIINNNRLVELPELGHQHSLATLSLVHNEIHSLGNSILRNLSNLHTLDVSYNNLVDLPVDTFGNSSTLRHLSLSYNRIHSIAKGVFYNLTALDSLKLNKNKFTFIPKDLFRHLSTLHHLEINSNTLSHIDGLSFQGLMSLVVLKLRHCSILHLLDGAFYGLSAIKKLQLDHNNISKVTKGWLYGLNSLQRLYLQHNNISEIEDDAWDSGKRLLELDMSENKLVFISAKTFDKLYSLKRLILADNLISYIEEGAFRALPALQYLELRNNEIFWTVEDTSQGQVFAGLDRLRFLGLSSNNIKAVVKRTFEGLLRLEILNLTNNELTTIERNSFMELPNLQILMINSSNLLCDCNLSWLVDEFHFPIVAKCGFPERFQGLPVFEVLQKDFLCEGSPKPVMIKEPYTKIRLKGENVTLECQAKSSGISDVRFQWRKHGKLLQSTRLWSKNANTKEGNMTLHSSWLFILNVEDKDEGLYQCIISNRFGSAYSTKARITVHVFPVFTKTPVDVAMKTGSTARLECGAKGYPQPDIAWRKEGGEDFPAARERRMHVMPTDHIFFIVDVKASDTGVYSCTAQNIAGVITANATLTVLESPSFAKNMEDKETRVGETALLECMAAGSPKPNLTWTKDNGPLQTTERHFFTADNQLLLIVQSKFSDSGVYTCTMSNSIGSEQGTSHLKVLPVAHSGNSVIEESNVTGIIVIAVVVCIVGTSIVWVIVIHHTRKTRDDFVGNASNGVLSLSNDSAATFSTVRAVCHKERKHSLTNMYLDSHSGHSKDSGTCDSVQPSSDDLLIEDDHGLLLDLHNQQFGGVARTSSFLALHDSKRNSQSVCGTYGSSTSSVSKEKVPLLHSFRTSHTPWRCHRKSIAELRQQSHNFNRYALSYGETTWPNVLVQRSLSLDHLNISDKLPHRGCSEPPQDCILTRVDSDGIEKDSGFSTFTRSVTQASVSDWSTESPRLHKLPKDIPNDSGSFSITSEDVHLQHPNAFPTIV